MNNVVVHITPEFERRVEMRVSLELELAKTKFNVTREWPNSVFKEEKISQAFRHAEKAKEELLDNGAVTFAADGELYGSPSALNLYEEAQGLIVTIDGLK